MHHVSDQLLKAEHLVLLDQTQLHEEKIERKFMETSLPFALMF